MAFSEFPVAEFPADKDHFKELSNDLIIILSKTGSSQTEAIVMTPKGKEILLRKEQGRFQDSLTKRSLTSLSLMQKNNYA